jgi:Domain of unknown function (DUF4279)
MPRAPKPANAPEGTVWFGGHVERISVCLRILGDQLDPLDVTTLLGREPTRAGRKGDPILRPNGEVARYRRIGAWLFEPTTAPDATLSEALEALLRELPQDADLWQSLRKQFKADLLCHVTVRGVNQGFVLSPEVLKSIAALGIPLGVDIFAEADEEQSRLLKERLGGSA